MNINPAYQFIKLLIDEIETGQRNCEMIMKVQMDEINHFFAECKRLENVVSDLQAENKALRNELAKLKYDFKQ